MPTAIVTGGSSGIGLATVKALLDKGCKVYELSRRDFDYPKVTHLSVDVTDETRVKEAIATILADTDSADKEDIKVQGIDILVNCAGFGISGAVEYTKLEDAKRQMEVNFFGMVNTTKAVLSHMRENGGGRIVNISSVAAVAPIPFQTYYSASKAAINSYTCALANEVRPYGVSVTAIMPGDIKTGFTAARAKSNDGDDAYGGRIERSVSKMENDEMNGMEADFAGRYIAKIALRKNVKPIYSIGFTYKLLSVLCNIMPIRFKTWLLGKLYA